MAWKIKPISTFTEEQQVDPQTDLITVCANCHRMIHRKPNDILTIEELKIMIQEMAKNADVQVVSPLSANIPIMRKK